MMSTPRRGRRLRFPRGAFAAGLTLFLVLAGAGVAAAVWTAASSSLTSTVSAGSLVVTQTGSAGLNATYGPATSDTAVITITNTGTVPATAYTMQIRARTQTALSDNTTLTRWPVTSAANCTSTTAIPAGTVKVTLTAGLSNTSTLAVGAADLFCVRTSIPGKYTTVTISEPQVSLSYSTGSWNGSSLTTAIQSMDGTPPSAPGRPAASATGAAQTTLTWAASTDNVGVTAYDVYRDGVVVGTIASPSRTFTDTGLVRGATYTYTVTARDAAANTSVASATRNVTTLLVDNGARYQVVDTNSSLCVDAGTAAAATNTPLVIFACDTARSQSWQFVAVGSFFKIVPAASTSFSWDIDNTAGFAANDGQKARLTSFTAGTNTQLWQVASDSTGGGKVRFINQGYQKCLDVQNAQTTNGTPLQQSTCSNTAAQSFTLTQLP